MSFNSVYQAYKQVNNSRSYNAVVTSSLFQDTSRRYAQQFYKYFLTSDIFQIEIQAAKMIGL